MNEQTIRQLIINATKELVGSICYYDRKDDEELSREDFNKAIETKLITKEEIIYFFTQEINDKLG